METFVDKTGNLAQSFNGKIFKLYKGQRYFKRCGSILLHRAVWEFYNGEIPEGYQIHHKDEDRYNNEIDNLECIEGVEHARQHALSIWANDLNRAKLNSASTKKQWDLAPTEDVVCVNCDIVFEAKCFGSKRKFCSSNCSKEYRKQCVS